MTPTDETNDNPPMPPTVAKTRINRGFAMAPNVDMRGTGMDDTISKSDCNPISVAAFLKTNNSKGIGLTYGGTACQVCMYEGRTRKSLHVVICDHGLRCCAARRHEKVKPTKFVELIGKAKPGELDLWLCPNRDAMCWQKLHSFYIPGGLFGKKPSSKWDLDGCPKTVSVSITSKMYRAKMEWMVKVGLAASNRKRGQKRKVMTTNKESRLVACEKNTESASEATDKPAAEITTTAAPSKATERPVNEIQVDTTSNPMSPATMVDVPEGPASPDAQTFYSATEAV